MMKSLLVLPIFFAFVVSASVRREDLDRNNGSTIIESNSTDIVNESVLSNIKEHKIDFHTFEQMRHDTMYSDEEDESDEDHALSDAQGDKKGNSSKVVEVNQVHPSASVKVNGTHSSESIDSSEDNSSENRTLNRDYHSAETGKTNETSGVRRLTEVRPSDVTKTKEILSSQSLKPDDELNEDLLDEIRETNSSLVDIEPEVKLVSKTEENADTTKVVDKRAKKQKTEQSEETTISPVTASGDIKVTLPSEAVEKFREHQTEIQEIVKANKQKSSNAKLENSQASASNESTSEEVLKASHSTPVSIGQGSSPIPESDSSTGLNIPRSAVSAADTSGAASASAAQTAGEKATEITDSVSASKRTGDFNQTVQLPPLTTGNDGSSASQSVQILGDKANATITRTSNSLSIEAHNIL